MIVKQLLLVQYPCQPSLRCYKGPSDCSGLRPCTTDARHDKRQRLLQYRPGIARASTQLHYTSDKSQGQQDSAVAAPGIALEVSHVSKAFGDQQVRSYR